MALDGCAFDKNNTDTWSCFTQLCKNSPQLRESHFEANVYVGEEITTHVTATDVLHIVQPQHDTLRLLTIDLSQFL